MDSNLAAGIALVLVIAVAYLLSRLFTPSEKPTKVNFDRYKSMELEKRHHMRQIVR